MLGRCLRGVQQQIHQHLRQLVRIGTNVRQVRRDFVLQYFSTQHGLMLDERDRVGGEAMLHR